MKFVWFAMLILNGIVLASVVFLHVHALDAFSMTWISPAKKGELLKQRYVQTTGDPTYLLVGFRREIKRMELPAMSFNFESRVVRAGQTTGGKSKEGREPEFTLGVSRTLAGKPDSDFFGRYLHLKYWLVETVLGLVMLVWLWLFVKKRR